MHFVMVTLLALGAQPVPQAVQPAPYGAQMAPPQGAYGGEGMGECNCEKCRAKRCNGGADLAQHFMMPQTCYSPRYGCYFGNERFMNRYPAFHGNYYRRPYNYRNMFDYPWHAEMHEPTSLFSYNVPAAAEDLPPGPPTAARQYPVNPRAQIQRLSQEPAPVFEPKQVIRPVTGRISDDFMPQQVVRRPVAGSISDDGDATLQYNR